MPNLLYLHRLFGVRQVDGLVEFYERNVPVAARVSILDALEARCRGSPCNIKRVSCRSHAVNSARRSEMSGVHLLHMAGDTMPYACQVCVRPLKKYANSI